MILYFKKHARVLGGFEYLHVDNVESNPGSGGAVFRSDDVGSGVQVPFAKLMDGTDGSSAVIPGDATNGLFVQVKASTLPSGAATAAKQPALGTAGTAATDVITVQGIASGTALIVNGSGVTQPVSGTVAVSAISTSVTPGTAAANLGKAEDAAHTSGDVGVMALNVRNDSRGTLAGADGDYAPGQLNASGDLRVDASAVAVPVTDNSGSLTVDNGGTFAVQVTSVTPGTAATSLGKAEDAAHTTGDVGVMALVVRVDSAAALAGADGDYSPLQVDANGALRVTGGGGGTQYAEDAAHTTGDIGTLALVRRSDTAASSATTDGDYATLNTDSSGRLWVNASGAAVPITDNSGSLTVDNGGTFAVQATIAAGAAAIAKAEDVASADADVGVPAMAVRKATPANTSNADGDYEMLQMSAGRLWVDPSGVTLTVASHAVTNAGTFVVQAGTAAHDAAVSGNPVRIAGRAATSAYTAVADGDTADLLTTILGKLVTMPYALPGATWKYVGAAGGIVTTTAITIKAAGGAGVINYITSITLVNSHQTTGTEVVINDGAAGTAIFRTWCQAAGGGVSIQCIPPLASTANTLLEIKEVTTTGTAGIVAQVIGYSAAE